MTLVAAFFRLIRWPNLLFIAVTQWLFYFSVTRSVFSVKPPVHPSLHGLFYILIFSSVCIAAGGYIINDYFDLQIDVLNKPGKVVVDRKIKRRWAIIWHLILSTLGILASFYISYRTGNIFIVLTNIGCVLLLWFYSTTFKKKLLIGNVLIAAMTAWVILVVYIFAGASVFNLNGWDTGLYSFDVKKLFKLSIVYAGFAFIVSLMREVVKDLEDMYGDSKYQCKTMPIVWGVPATKVFTAVWIVVCASALAVFQIYAWQSGKIFIAIYLLVLIFLPLIYILRELYRAKTPSDYNRLSGLIKLIMLNGILSMLFFNFYP